MLCMNIMRSRGANCRARETWEKGSLLCFLTQAGLKIVMSAILYIFVSIVKQQTRFPGQPSTDPARQAGPEPCGGSWCFIRHVRSP